MALIDKDEMCTLKPASEVREVANSAVAILEEMSMANLINSAANTGECFAVWEHPLSDALLQKLETNGYHVKQKRHAANPSVLWEIRWNS